MGKQLYTHSRYRAVVTALVFWAVFVGVFVVVSRSFSFFPPIASPWWGVRHGITGTLLALGTTAVFLRWQQVTFHNAGLVWSRTTLPGFFTGLVVGALVFAAILFTLIGFTMLEISPAATVNYEAVFLGCVMLVPLAFMEELAFRGYPFRLLNTTYGLWVVQIVTAVVFALYHVAGGWSVAAAFSGPFVWSFVFGLGAVLSRGIAVPTGIHVALNVGQMLVGMKRDDSIWKLSFLSTASPSDRAGAETLGLVLQGMVFVVALAATAWGARTNKKTE
ncbi:CPBP family intramembrane metalloprotease [Fulvivirgaceae bacterium PWU5]|uniref:CPBP family intramembrane metalloprotease n=1 Tax=Dawidia cretensis TaxID=2782350 RepID=A0AAP2E345_9BACT|nr:CPBP family intramembrane glutamic endopeptidase [Dawidia cretensis]MBT1710737.1 CPBP family intramembrane metalloprotease [Dawidia cretensis]